MGRRGGGNLVDKRLGGWVAGVMGAWEDGWGDGWQGGW